MVRSSSGRRDGPDEAATSPDSVPLSTVPVDLDVGQAGDALEVGRRTAPAQLDLALAPRQELLDVVEGHQAAGADDRHAVAERARPPRGRAS